MSILRIVNCHGSCGSCSTICCISCWLWITMADSCSQQSVYMDCGLPFQLLARETESEPKIIQDPPSVSVGMMCANANAHKRCHSFLSSFVVLLVPSTAHPVGKSQTVKYEPPCWYIGTSSQYQHCRCAQNGAMYDGNSHKASPSLAYTATSYARYQIVLLF
jgi:hypothetical protein